MHTNASNRRSFKRLIAAGLIGAAIFSAGCASEGMPAQSSLPFGKNARDESIRKQAQSDSFPKAKQAGL